MTVHIWYLNDEGERIEGVMHIDLDDMSEFIGGLDYWEVEWK